MEATLNDGELRRWHEKSKFRPEFALIK
jgi:hypothetical protein